MEHRAGTTRREFLDHVLFWNACDLERKLAEFQACYHAARGHLVRCAIHALSARLNAAVFSVLRERHA
jgi:hypothetical protein